MRNKILAKAGIAATALGLVVGLALAAQELQTQQQATGQQRMLAADETPGAPGPGRRFGPPGGRGPGFERPDLREELGLTHEQVEQLHALKFEGAKQAIQARAQLQLRRLELRELFRAEPLDRAAITRKVSELSDAQHTLLLQRTEQHMALLELLTPEQRARFKESRHRFRRGHKGFLRPGPGRPGMRGEAFGGEGNFEMELEPEEPAFFAPVAPAR